MLYLLLMSLVTSCNALPQLYQAAEDIATDEAIEINVSREALQKETNLSINVDVTNSNPVK